LNKSSSDPFKLVAVALANKMARIAFAILRGKTVYREIPAKERRLGSRLRPHQRAKAAQEWRVTKR
jgi:hypothetical protein